MTYFCLLFPSYCLAAHRFCFVAHTFQSQWQLQQQKSKKTFMITLRVETFSSILVECLCYYAAVKVTLTA